MKTSELTGAALDWAVAKCEGHTVYLRHDFLKERAKYLNHDGSTIAWHLSQQTNDLIIGTLETGQTQYVPFYSTDWAQGGPIIEREKINLRHDPDCNKAQAWEASDDIDFFEAVYGDTPLIAAMRCYVASKLGDEVDVPKELI